MSSSVYPEPSPVVASLRLVRTTHVISHLMTGGSETMLLKLLAATPRELQDPRVVSLLSVGTVGPRIRALGIPVEALEIRRVPGLPAALLALRRTAGRTSTDVVVGWMYHGNLAASLGASLARGSPVIWNIRHSVYDLADEKQSTAWLIRLGAKLSGRAAAIVYNSHIARKQHERLGYASARSTVIPNGFDTACFAPDSSARASVRAELGLPQNALLLGMVARLHPMKDHVGLLRAFATVRERVSGAHLLLAGRDVVPSQPHLAAVLRELGLGGAVHLLGERADMPRLAASLDVALSSSFSEGMPNTVGEAMACGVPCVVTDVGDSALLVGPTGVAVPPRDSQAFAAACTGLLEGSEHKRRELGNQARRRIEQHFGIEAIAKRFQALFAAVAAGSC